MCVLVLTLCEVALWQSVGDVRKLAAVVAVLQRADVHVAPLLQLLQPAALLLALAVGIEHYAYPQCTWRKDGGQRSGCKGSRGFGVLFKSVVLTEGIDPGLSKC